ncbi:MAG: P-loop NTPase [Candidatus Zixiibacteriota bacterium]|nr:MAG: P-loop NTPase [candidate division Zixibacteria bacterium]
MAGIQNIIAVASGKGGVGKSTVCTNLAVALSQLGLKVGLMDADIYGPSQPGMLGSADAKPDIANGQLRPVNKHGVDFISMGLLIPDDSPVIWRAPMAMKMIQQFIGSVVWGRLDYLFIDLPPGTGDVQLTLAQQASLTGAIIVTTPQQVALGVARKGLRMFEQVNVPIVGIIENMSGFTCEHCGQVTAVFKEGGGRQMAETLSVPYLGAIPLDPAIMMSGEEGTPVLTNGSETPAAKSFISIAENVKKSAESIHETLQADQPRDVKMSKEGNLLVVWPDEHESLYTPHHLRLSCVCASCIDEDTGKQLLDTGKVPLDIKITGVSPVGRYGLSVSFSDGHNTGIYTFNRLKQICECEKCTKDKKQDSFTL